MLSPPVKGVITTKPFKVKKFVWTPTADADDILLVDNSGHLLWVLVAIAGTATETIPYEMEINGSINGLTISTLSAGTLYVYQ